MGGGDGGGRGRGGGLVYEWEKIEVRLELLICEGGGRCCGGSLDEIIIIFPMIGLYYDGRFPSDFTFSKNCKSILFRAGILNF